MNRTSGGTNLDSEDGTYSGTRRLALTLEKKMNQDLEGAANPGWTPPEVTEISVISTTLILGGSG